jgi:hypothetical protein
MKKVLSLLLLASPFVSFAHEGHGHTGGFTIIHYFIEPMHLMTYALIGIVLYLFYKSIMQKEKHA